MEIESEILNESQLNWIKDSLSNDENSSDEELVEFFINEIGLTQQQAEYWISKRTYYLTMQDFPIHPKRLFKTK